MLGFPFAFSRRISGSGAFDPATLFAGGENGVWYEPSTTTAFRSTTDLTPCAVGQSCGFLLDKSQGAGYSGGALTGLGSELVTNGTFDTDLTGWGKTEVGDGVAGWSGGAATLTSSKNYPADRVAITQNFTAAAGFYLISFEVLSSDTSFAWFLVGTANGSSDLSGTAWWPAGGAGVARRVVNHPGGSMFIEARISGTASVDNVTVQRIPGLHATQGTAAARPVLRQTGGGVYYLEDDEVDDALNWTAPADTDYTVARVNSSGTVTILTGQSLSGATDILLDPALVAYIAVDRALTAGETSGLTAYLEALA